MFWRRLGCLGPYLFVKERKKIKNFQQAETLLHLRPLRPLQPPNGLRAYILPQIWNLWPKMHMQLCLLRLFRPPFIRCEKITKETDNYYTCVALHAAGNISLPINSSLRPGATRRNFSFHFTLIQM